VFNVAGALIPEGLAQKELAIRGLDSAKFRVAVIRERHEANFAAAEESGEAATLG
jgi:hypothetical protein